MVETASFALHFPATGVMNRNAPTKSRKDSEGTTMTNAEEKN
jgi:hypothetical protein